MNSSNLNLIVIWGQTQLEIFSQHKNNADISYNYSKTKRISQGSLSN